MDPRKRRREEIERNVEAGGKLPVDIYLNVSTVVQYGNYESRRTWVLLERSGYDRGLTTRAQYMVTLNIPFSGVGNNIKGEIPLKVISSMWPAESTHSWDGPPPELDLPP